MLRAGELGPLFQALYFQLPFLRMALLTSFPVPGDCEMKPANGPWSLEAMEATSLPSLYRAESSCGTLYKSL